MSSENDLYDRTVRKLLTEQVERGVPDSTNLWPEIERRLALREEPAQQQPPRSRPFEWLLGAATWARPDTARAGEGKARRYAPAFAGAVGLIALALVATFAVSGLAQHPARGPVGTQKPSPVATGTAGQMISLVPEGDGFRLEAVTGTVGAHWLNASTLHAWWQGPAGPEPFTSTDYIVDLGASKVPRPISGNVPGPMYQASPNKQGTYAVATWTDPQQAQISSLGLLDVSNARTEVVLSSEYTATQWLPPAEAQAVLTGTEGFSEPVWLEPDTFAVVLFPRPDPGSETHNPYNWGRVALVNIGKRTVGVVADKGQPVAALPDGTFLLRTGWIDGPIVALAPPYTGTPTTIAPAGTWRAIGSVSPDGKKVAWLELTPRPGDWSKRVPYGCCGGDPAPQVTGIAVWDRDTNRVQQYPVSSYAWSVPGVGWSEGEKLSWRNDSNALYYSTYANPDGSPAGEDDDFSKVHTELHELDLTGKLTLLTQHQGPSSFVDTQGRDGSIYYEVRGQAGQLTVELLRLRPDGVTEVVHKDALPSDWMILDYRKLVTLEGNLLALRDLATGEARQAPLPGTQPKGDTQGGAMDIAVVADTSTDSQWVIYNDAARYYEPSVLRILKTQPAPAVANWPTQGPNEPTSTALVEIPPLPTVAPTLPVGVDTPVPTATAVPLALVREGDGYRLQGLTYQQDYAHWIGPARILVAAPHPANENGDPSLLVDVTSGQLRQVDIPGPSFDVVGSPDGGNALLMRIAFEAGHDGVRLLHWDTGKLDDLLDLSKGFTGTQVLPGAEAAKWPFGNVHSTITAKWIDNDTYLIARTPIGDGIQTAQGWAGWGMVLIGSVSQGTLRTLTPQGQVVAVLPDKSLLIRSGWIDGEVQLLAPPYTGKPVRIDAAGKWTNAFSVSPNGQKVAWFEMKPPPTLADWGDWTHRLPTWMEDGPQPYAISVWNRGTGQMDRIPITGPVLWVTNTWLHWRRDGSALVYARYNANSPNGSTDLMQVALDGSGKVSVIANSAPQKFIYNIASEGKDGSLYYYTSAGQPTGQQLVKRHPDGTTEVICPGICGTDEQGRLLQTIVQVNGTIVTVTDLPSGTTLHADLPQAVTSNLLMLSPDGQWIAYHDGAGGTVYFIRLK